MKVSTILLIGGALFVGYMLRSHSKTPGWLKGTGNGKGVVFGGNSGGGVSGVRPSV